MAGGGAAKSLVLELTGKNAGLSRMLADSDAKVKAFTKSVDSSNKHMSLSQAAVKGAAAGLTALAVGLAYAVSKAAAFDTAMRNVNSLTKGNEKQFASMEKQVISMSTKLPQSATTLAEGLYDIASSGFQGADGIKVLDAAARSASAGLTTTAVSARAITGVLNAYGLTAKDAADVSDVLFSTVNLGVISFDELANNLGDVVGSAAAAGVSIDQVGSAIATMTLSGIKGSQATTSLSSLTTKLVQPSAALAKLYKQLGYESGAAALKGKGLHGVMEDIRKATGGNITTMLQLFPDIEAARGALALMANEGQNYTKVSDQITDKNKRQGATQAVLNEQMKSVSAQWKLFQNQIDASAITVGVKLLPALLELMDATKDVGGGIADFVGKLRDGAAPGIGKLGDAVHTVAEFLRDLGKIALSIGEPLGKLATTAAVGTFNELASALAKVTEFAADNQNVVIALGIAYGLQASGGINALMKGLAGVSAFLGGNWKFRMYDAAEAALGLGDNLKSAGKKAGAFIQAVAPAAAIGTALTVAIVAWQNYSAGAEEGANVTKKAEQAMNSFNVNEMATSLREANDFIADTNKRLEEFSGEKHIGIRFDDVKKFFDYSKNSKTLGMVEQLDEVQKAAYNTQLAMSQLQYNTVEIFKVMGKPLPDAAKWINDVQGANGAKAQVVAMEQMQGVLDTLGPKLQAAGVDMTKAWDTQQLTNAYSALQGVKDGSDRAAESQKAVIAAMGGAAASMGDATAAADNLKAALDGLTGAAIGVDQAQIQWLQGLASLRTELGKNGATLSLNSKAGQDNRLAIIGQVQNLQDLLVANANAGATQEQLTGKLAAGRQALINAGVAAKIPKAAMEALLTQYKLTPELVQTLIKESGSASAKAGIDKVTAAAKEAGKQKPKPTVTAQTTAAQAQLNAVQNRLDQIDGRHASASVTVTSTQITVSKSIHTSVENHLERQGITNERGGIWKFDDGGMLPSQAVIQKQKAPFGLVQWAEPGTGDEAFIPMAPGKRGRSTAILSTVADAFGMMLVDKFASGGFRYPAFKYPAFRYDPKGGARSQQSKQYLADKASKKHDYETARYQAYEDYLDKNRTAATAAGRYGAGIFQPGGTAGDTFTSLASAKEARAQAAAELKARNSRSPSDSAEDYYKKPVISLKEYLAALKQTETYQRQWNTTLRNLSDKVGIDVVKTLQGMGEEGEAAIRKMATGSVADMKKMAAQIRAMEFGKFFTDTSNDVKGHAAFQANLQALVKMGRADLASRFEQLGYDQAAGLAATAVTSPGSTLTQLNNLLAQQESFNDPKMGDAMKLAALIQKSGGKLGVVGLANSSGMPVGDVLGLLQGFEGTVFGKIPTAAMKQIRADQALLKNGKQPSGYAMGTIIPSSKTGYYYGEPDSGGESLIPHGIDRRRRALQLWHETGRILGAGGGGGGGGGGQNFTIADGAIRVELTVTKAGATAADIEQATTRAVNSSMSELVRQLTTGRR